MTGEAESVTDSSKRRRAGARVRGHLRDFGIALMQSIVILVVVSMLYVLGYLAIYQRLPRWK